MFCATIANGTSKSHEWVIDSGASCHMTWDRKLLSDYVELSPAQKVKLGDGRTIEAIGYVSVKIDMFHDDLRETFAPKTKVLYILDMSCNLLSVHTVTSKGNAISFNEC